MTTEPLAPEPLTAWTDNREGDVYQVVPPEAFEDFSEVDSTTVDLPDVDDPEDDS